MYNETEVLKMSFLFLISYRKFFLKMLFQSLRVTVQQRGYYRFLGNGVNANSKPDQLKSAYFQQLKKCNPDIGFATIEDTKQREERIRNFNLAKTAYERLCDPTLKSQYDQACEVKRLSLDQEVEKLFPKKTIFSSLIAFKQKIFKPAPSVETVKYDRSLTETTYCFLDCSGSMYDEVIGSKKRKTFGMFSSYSRRLDLAYEQFNKVFSQLDTHSTKFYGFSTECRELPLHKITKADDIEHYVEAAGTDFIDHCYNIVSHDKGIIKIFLFTDGQIFLPYFAEKLFIEHFNRHDRNQFHCITIDEVADPYFMDFIKRLKGKTSYNKVDINNLKKFEDSFKEVTKMLLLK